jgi:uncharacterized protein (TIGR00645 family)
MPERIREMLESALEGTPFAPRWLLAPFDLAIVLGIVILLIKFMQELFHLAAIAFRGTEADVILGTPSLVDMALTGSLLLIAIFSGYENFISKIDHSAHRNWPEWMGTSDFTALKLKVLSSIVAISAIHLLQQFMSIRIGQEGMTPANDRELIWYVVIHLLFVISSVLLALSDRIAEGGAQSAKAMAPTAQNGKP